MLKLAAVSVSFFDMTGLLAEEAGPECVQTQHHQLLSPDHSQPDAEHHHVQAGQAAQGRLWATTQQESREWIRPVSFIRPPLNKKAVSGLDQLALSGHHSTRKP